MFLSVFSPASYAEDIVPLSRPEITLSFAPVAKQVSPAVVNIYTSRREQVRSPFFGMMQDPFFEQFFNRSFGNMPRERVVNSLGSGVIVDKTGLVVTSNHVIQGAEDIVVALADGREMKAKISVQDPSSDLALLKLPGAKNIPALTLGNSDALEVGDLVLAVGNPFGVGQTVTSGIVSALARPASGVSDYNFFIQTDAAINPGNSGGALVNMKGELVGVNTAIYSKTGGSLGIGFAIPSSMISALLNSNGEKSTSVIRPWLGATYQPMSQEIADSLGLETPRGALVVAVNKDSPADKSGLKSGDIITGINQVAVDSPNTLRFRVATANISEPVTLDVLRDGKTLSLPVTLILPPEIPPRDARTLKGQHPLNEVTVINLSPRVAMELGTNEQKGVLITKVGGTRVGMQPGDRLLAINGTEVTGTKQLQTLMVNRVAGWEIDFERGGRKLTLQVVR